MNPTGPGCVPGAYPCSGSGGVPAAFSASPALMTSATVRSSIEGSAAVTVAALPSRARAAR